MNQENSTGSKQDPKKDRVANTNENYGTKERPTHPKGADQMNESFARPGTDQEIIEEATRSTGKQNEPGR